jgi:CDP-glycerol glycerophosphotransferase
MNNDPAAATPELANPSTADNAVGALRADVSQVLGEIVGHLNELRSDLDQLQPEAKLQSLARRVTTLELRMPEVRALRMELDRDRMRAAFTHMSRMHPKRRAIVFVGRDYFGDNLKYAYLGALDAATIQDFDCWYLPFDAAQERMVRALGGQCLPADHAEWSGAHLSLALETAVLVVCDHFTKLHHPNPFATALFAGARWVQLWHGISIKEVGLRNQIPLARVTPEYAELLASCGSYAAFLGSSAAAEGEWRRWFSFRRYAPIGFPRNDVLQRQPSERDLINVDFETLEAMRATRAAGGRVFLYAPTFRDGRPEWIRDIGLQRLADGLSARGDRLVVNLHPLEHAMLAELCERLPQVGFVRARSDLYPLLAQTSALITDYSSLMFDFLPLDRPIVFFRPDHQRYVSDSRQLYDAKVRQLPGPVADSVEALLGVLLGSADPAYEEIRRELMHRLFDHVDGEATTRLMTLLGNELDIALAAHRFDDAGP